MGMTLHFHYCCGKIDKVDVVAVKKEDCGSPKHVDKKDCCDNKQLELKIKDDQQKDAESKSLDKPALSENDLNTTDLSVPFLTEVPVTGFTDTSPPLFSSKALLQLYCIYRI